MLKPLAIAFWATCGLSAQTVSMGVTLVCPPAAGTTDPVLKVLKPASFGRAGKNGVRNVVSVVPLSEPPQVWMTASGIAAEVVVPGVSEIRLPGYDPKSPGQIGNVALLRFSDDGGIRYLRLAVKDGKPARHHRRGVPETQLSQDANGWRLTLRNPLKPGHYAVTFPRMGSTYWAFDVM